MAGQGHAGVVAPKADDPEDADDAELMEDSGAEEMLMEDDLVGLSKSAVGATKVCAKTAGDNCTCKGIMGYGPRTNLWRTYIRVDGTETCSSDPSYRRRNSKYSSSSFAKMVKMTNKKYNCLCFDLDNCTDIATASDRTIDEAHRRRRSSMRSGRRRGTGLAQRRRWCGLGGGDLPDCKFSDWMSWSECQKRKADDQGGIQIRERSLKEPDPNACDGDFEEERPCS